MTLVVEDGTGLSNADAYISVVDAGTYFAAFSTTDPWLDYDAATQEIAIRSATRALDNIYGDAYASYPLTTTQSLLMPRKSWTNAYGFVVTGLPAVVAQATAELALLILTGNDPLDGSDDTGRVRETKIVVGEIQELTTYFYPVSVKGKQLSKVATILASVLDNQSPGPFAKVVRG
jgi:hypothetical protein